jgi:predicted phosphate transport protein (TIGR00153 family)
MMLRSIIPRDEEFFTMFDELTAAIVDGTEILQRMMTDGENSTVMADRLHECEHRGDETVHRALAHLHRTFVTPLDRLDIHRLVNQLDDILDFTHAAGSRLALYQPRTLRPEALDLSSTLLAAAGLVQEMVSLLRNLKKKDRIMALTVEVNTRENQADRQRREAVARLLQEESDPFEFIKWKEILDLMEQATDCCEDVADIVEGIVLAHG